MFYDFRMLVSGVGCFAEVVFQIDEEGLRETDAIGGSDVGVAAEGSGSDGFLFAKTSGTTIVLEKTCASMIH